MADSKIIQTIVKYTYDAQGGAAVIAGGKAVRASIEGVTTSVKQLSALDVGGQNVKKLSATFEDQRQRIANLRREQQGFRADLESSIPNIEKETVAVKNLTSEFDKLAASERLRVSGFKDSNGGGGTAGARGKAISRFGNEFRQLPSARLPGVPISSDQVANLVRMAGALDQLAEKVGITRPQLLSMGVAVAALGVAVFLAGEQFKAAKKNADAAIAGREKAIDLLNLGTKEEQQARINDLQNRRDANAAQLLIAKDLLTKLRNEFVASQGGGVGGLQALGLVELGAQVGIAGAEFKSAEESVSKYTAAVGESTTELDILTKQTGLAAKSTAQMAAELFNVARVQSDINNQFNADLEAAKLANQGTSEALKKRKDDLILEIGVIETSTQTIIDRAKALGLETVEGKAAIAEASKISESSTPLRVALAAISQTFIESTIKMREAEAALKQEADQIYQDRVSATQKFNADIVSIENKGEADLIKLYEKLGDKQVDIAAKTVEDSEKVLKQLEAKRDALQTNLLRSLDDQQTRADFDAIQNQIKFQRNEVAEERRHQTELLQIQRESDDKAFELGLDRDFAGLARLRRETAQRLTASNQSFNDDRATRLQKFADDNTDQQAQFIFDREQKLKKYGLDLLDADLASKAQLRELQLSKQKQLQAALTAYSNDLRLLNDKVLQEIATREKAITDELQVIEAGDAAKLELEREYYRQSQDLIRGIYNAATPANLNGNINGQAAPLVFKARGGALANGQGAFVNERSSSGRESFSNRNGTIPLPGYGIFQPLGGGGQVNSNNRAMNINVPITIQAGGNPSQINGIVPALRTMVRDEMADAFRQLNAS